MTKVDAEGVPCMVQEVIKVGRKFKVTFFSGHIRLFNDVDVCSVIPEADITEMAFDNWSTWYPQEEGL